MKHKWQYLLLSLIVFAIGCDSLPENLRNQVKQCPQDLKKVERVIAMADSSFKVFKKSGDYATFHSKYDKRESWSANFSAATRELELARVLFEGQISRIADNNKSADAEPMQLNLGQFQKYLDAAIDYAAKPSRRIAQLSEARKSASKWAAEAETKYGSLASSVGALGSLVSDAQGKYSWKKDDLAKRFFPAQKLRSDASESLDDVRAQMRPGESDRDYAVLADGVTKVGQLASALSPIDSDLRTRVGQLNRSYAKILVDMKAVPKPMAEIVRYEWSEYSDWDNTSEAGKSERAITMVQYNDWKNRIGDGIRIAGGEGSGYEELVEEVFLDSTYFHKYTIEENGSTSNTDWTSVTEDYYDDHLDDLGMAVVVKPLGYYEDETFQAATPPGMHLVGNSQAGQWKRDASGNSFWEFYGKYQFYSHLFGYRPYYQNDWRDWDSNYRGRRAYYGSDSKEDHYGSSSSAARTRFATSNYASQGGFKAADPSVRGAGAARRGGGPGGAGK